MSALGEIDRDTETGNRNAVVFSAAAVEVLLKTRLALEHWTLLFDDPARAKLQDLKNGDFVSVQASRLVQRLNNVASLGLETKRADQIFKLRNRMVHFGPGPKIATRLEVSRSLGFALDFLHDHLLPELPDEEQQRLEELKTELTATFAKIDDFKAGRLRDLKAELGTHAIVITCPDCQQDALVIDGDEDENRCLFCLALTGSEELAERYVSDILGWTWTSIAEGGTEPLQECIECSGHALVGPIQVVNRPKISYVCFSCATTLEETDVDWCARCGDMKRSNGDSLCSSCWRVVLPD